MRQTWFLYKAFAEELFITLAWRWHYWDSLEIVLLHFTSHKVAQKEEVFRNRHLRPKTVPKVTDIMVICFSELNVRNFLPFTSLFVAVNHKLLPFLNLASLWKWYLSFLQPKGSNFLPSGWSKPPQEPVPYPRVLNPSAGLHVPDNSK